MYFFESAKFGLLAEGWGELIGPIIVFGIYIIGSLAKNIAQKEPKEPEDEKSSRLKEAVMKRREQIRQRQMGERSKEAPPLLQKAPIVGTTIHPKEQKTVRKSQWAERQRVVREHTAKLQDQRGVTRLSQTNASQQTFSGNSRSKPLKAARPVKLRKQKQTHQTVSRKIDRISKRQPTGNLLQEMISGPGNLQSAIILKEILDQPVGLRDF